MALLLTEVRSPVPADPGCRESLDNLVSSHPAVKGKAQNLDRPPAFIPNMIIVLLKSSRRLVYVNGKNTAPHCHVDPAS